MNEDIKVDIPGDNDISGRIWFNYTSLLAKGLYEEKFVQNIVFHYFSRFVALEDYGFPTVHTKEINSNQGLAPDLTLLSIHGTFSGSPSKGSKQKSLNVTLKNKVRK